MQPMVIDIAAGVVTADEYRSTGQWVVFWGVLATEHADGSALTSDKLAAWRPWDAKSRSSVGKEVARHISRPAVRAYLITAKATQAWSLAPTSPRPILLPSPQAVRDWLSVRRPEQPSATALASLASATVALHDGRHEEVEALLAEVGNNDVLIAWRDTIQARTAAKLGDTDTPEAILQRWRDRHDGSPTTRAVVARLSAAKAFRDRTLGDEASLGSLRKLASRLSETGDLASLGVVLNVLGVAERRAGDPASAVRTLERAAGYLGLVGDLYSLQGALYNLALALDSTAKQRRQPRPRAAVEALNACMSLCARFDVARDSAQAELTAARWSLDEDDRERVLHLLSQAERLVSLLESELESAFFHYVRGLCAARWPDTLPPAAGELKRARRLYAAGGDAESMKQVQRTASRLGIDLTEEAATRGKRRSPVKNPTA